MEVRGGYSQFCPVAMASEILCSRWTTLIVREMLCGTTRFNDLRRGVPRMSPALLSKRLKELQKAGIVVAVAETTAESSNTGCRRPARISAESIMSLGFWGQRWVESESVAEESRPVAADVGHAPPPQSTSRCRRDAARYSFNTPNCRIRGRNWWLVIHERPGRPVRIRPRLRDRPAGQEPAQGHDGDLDGHRQSPPRGRGRQRRAGRRALRSPARCSNGWGLSPFADGAAPGCVRQTHAIAVAKVGQRICRRICGERC